MAESNPQQEKTPSDYISDSDTSDDEADEHSCTSQEQHYNIIRGSAQATQAAHSYTTAQCNPTVKRGPPRQPRVRHLPVDKAQDKTTQTKDKDNSQ